ncbi:NUDIX hydrolase [Fadolivirus algeromassiliense]|jgi:hypothetical protein|uniref:NUDIX hydrolase n=1 Tax=Fadolivirus FV1/VV64 TaxID=3070911 RepID=A0A7D3QUP2_9VIRU|nr:NUDIX hydrolase [Fadolivirus algeromassiliense]QKF93724.1 NUDIX hydrolase [Fadolivirus FV1/VV64]
MLNGAGILILESYIGNPVVTLFGLNGMNYTEPGGGIEPGETPQDNAYREGREETANLVHINPNELLQYAFPIYLKHYVAYVVYVENLSYQDYMHNINVIFNNCYGTTWKESNSMVRIPVNNLVASAMNSFNYAVDINGFSVPIRKRTIDLFKHNHTAIMSRLNTMPIHLHRHLVTTSRMPCLIGTYTYTITSQSIYTPVNMPGNIEYAVYIAPDLTQYSDPFLVNCNKTWGGMHVTVAGFHTKQPAPQKFLQHISNSGSQLWTISVDKIKVKGKTIYFTSNTLDTVADFLHGSGFKKIKGSKHSGVKWHITSECSIPSNIRTILKKQTWSLVLISRQNGIISWLDRYPLTVL